MNHLFRCFTHVVTDLVVSLPLQNGLTSGCFLSVVLLVFDALQAGVPLVEPLVDGFKRFPSMRKLSPLLETAVMRLSIPKSIASAWVGFRFL